MTNLEKLTKALELLETDKMTVSDFEQVFESFTKVLQELKNHLEKQITDTKSETLTSVEEISSNVKELEGELKSLVNSQEKNSLTKIKDLSQKLSSEIQRIESMIPDSPDLTYLEAKIKDVERSVEQIPDPIEPETGITIVEKINDLPTDRNELKIDVDHIKGIEKRETTLSNSLINRAIGIVDQRTSFLINKVSNLQTQVSNGTGGGGSIGGAMTGGTTGSILFVNPTGIIAQDNANLFWDDTDNRLGIGTATPAKPLEIAHGNAAGTDYVLRLSNSDASGYGSGLEFYSAYGPRTNAQIWSGPGLTGGTLNFMVAANTTNTLTSRANINSLGNLTIGPSTGQTSLFSVQGNAAIGTTYYNDVTAAPTNGLIVEGNVGIGTTNPRGNLSINPATNYTTVAANQVRIGESTNNVSYYLALGYYLDGSDYKSVIQSYAGSSAPLLLNPSGGNIGVGLTSPTARLHLPAGTATASTAPIKFTSGTLLTSAEAGTIEFLSDQFYMRGSDGLSIYGITNAAHLTIRGHSTQTNPQILIQTSGGSEVLRLYGDQGANIGVGNSTLQSNSGNFNTAFGFLALSGTLTGSNLSAFGYNALAANTSGTTNVAFGYNTLSANTTGGGNVAIGSNALAQGNSTGNVAIGVQALYANNGSSYNVAIGNSALTATTSGADNMAVGALALYTNVTGSNNSAIGSNALNLSTGSSNTAIGSNSGFNTTGDANIYIGFSAGKQQLAVSNKLLIGNQAYANAATELTNSIIYGVMASTPAAQTLTFNAISATLVGASTARAKLGGTIFNNFTDTSSTSTDGTENDLYSYTIAASAFGSDGDSVEQREHVQFVASATATRRLKKYFAGTLVFDSGALTLSLGGDFILETTVIRESSTVVRVSVSVVTTSASSIPYATYTRITSLTLTNTQILKTTGIAAGVGAASGDIVDKLSKVLWSSAA